MGIDLTSAWSFWYHAHDAQDWSRESYKKIHTVKTAEEFWGVFQLMTSSHISKGMFFVMKENIFPDWKSPENRRGGFWSIKLDAHKKKIDVLNVLKEWLASMISNCIVDINSLVTIHGLSLSPKNGHFIIKLWVRDTEATSRVKLTQTLPHVSGNKFTPFSYKI